MPAQSINIETRINALTEVLTKKAEQQVVSDALRVSNGDWEAALATLTAQLPDTSLKKVAFANALATWSNDNVTLIQVIVQQPGLNLHDVALNYNIEKLAMLVDSKVVPENIAGASDNKKKWNFAVALQYELLVLEPTAVLQLMVQEVEIPIADTSRTLCWLLRSKF